jgi:hypothetical protein
MQRRSGSVIMTNSANGRNVWEAILKIIDTSPTRSASAILEKQATDVASFTTWKPNPRTIRYEYRLMNPTSKPATGLDVFVPLPLESPRQEVHYLHLPKSPCHRVITDRHGQRLAHYTLDRLEPGEWIDLGYVAGITLRNMRWNYAATSSGDGVEELTPEARRQYLKAETNYSMESDLMRSMRHSNSTCRGPLERRSSTRLG